MMATLLTARIDALLRPLGFSRRGATWRRATDELVEIVNVQVGSGGDDVTINLGVVDCEVYQWAWGSDLPAFPDETMSTARIRLGELTDGRDRWWPLEDDSTPAALAEALDQVGLPFFEELRDHARMRDFLVAQNVRARSYPLDVIHLALLEHKLGRQTTACEILDDLRIHTIPGAWQARSVEVASRIGCACGQPD